MLEGVGLPFAYDHFEKKEAPAGPPFLCFLLPNSRNFAADGSVYQKIAALRIELYADAKDPALEARTEGVLDAAGIFYDKDETWIEAEHMHIVTYSAEILYTD